jgi:tetratricopeptide (TPR) repeat protein
MKRHVRSAVLIFLVGAMVLAASAMAEDKISPNLAKPMKEAQQAIQKKQWDQGLKKLAEAEALPGKTAFDQYQIYEFRGYILLQQKNYAEVAKVYEQGLGTVPAGKVNERLKTLIQLNSQTKNYSKVIEFGDRLLKAGGMDTDTRVTVASAQYQLKNYKPAIATMQDAIKSAEQAGKPVPESWLLLVRESQQQMHDTAGAAKTLEKLVRLYPKPEYWDYLLSTRLAQQNKDRVEINLFRLQSYVGVLKSPKDYLEMAEILLASGFPGEATRLLQAGSDAKVFEANPADKSKAARYLNNAKTGADKVQQSVPKLEQEAVKSPTGERDVTLGIAYAGLGQYDKAAEALARGLKKGGIEDPQQAQIMLGIAELDAGNKTEAIKTFGQVKDPDQNMVDVAQLWALAASSHEAPRQEAAKPAKPAKPKG